MERYSYIKFKNLDLKRFDIISDADAIGALIWEEVASWGRFEKDTLGKQLTPNP